MMGKPAVSRILPVSLLVIALFGSRTVQSQADTLRFNAPITAFSLSPADDIYLALADGTIIKYAANLDSLLAYSPQRTGRVTLLEAWHGFKVFAFYNDFQAYTIFDRFLSRPVQYLLGETGGYYADMCTLGQDQQLWIYEETGLRLLKINPAYREAEIEIPLEFILDPKAHRISYLKEYQNLLFLVDRQQGIYVFDNMGNYLRQINVPGAGNCQFRQGNLYMIAGGLLHIIELYGTKHKTVPLPAGRWQGLLPLQQKILLIGQQMAISMPYPATP